MSQKVDILPTVRWTRRDIFFRLTFVVKTVGGAAMHLIKNRAFSIKKELIRVKLRANVCCPFLPTKEGRPLAFMILAAAAIT